MKKTILFSLMAMMALSVSAKRVIGIHSHNDYNRQFPFFDAYKAHSTSIEADIFLFDGQLYVAHNEEDVRSWRTLTTMYLDPIKKLYNAYGQCGYADGTTYMLTVDLKDGAETLDALEKIIADGYLECFDVEHNPKAIMVCISGDVVNPEDFTKHPNFIYQDGRMGVEYTPEQLARIGMISQDFSDYVKWDGVRDLTKEEMALLKGLVDDVHKKGKPARFWAMPDTPKGWAVAHELGLDFINTDSPAKVREALDKQK